MNRSGFPIGAEYAEAGRRKMRERWLFKAPFCDIVRKNVANTVRPESLSWRDRGPPESEPHLDRGR